SLGTGRYVLDGNERMRQRPVGELVDLLRNLGVRVSYLASDGYLPIAIHAHGLAGGLLRFGAAKSSQFLSAVLMSPPFARHELWVNLDGRQTSWPYVAMTMQLMDVFNHIPELIRDTDTGEPKRIIIPRGDYSATSYAIEPDASNATYFLAAAALHKGSKLTV